MPDLGLGLGLSRRSGLGCFPHLRAEAALPDTWLEPSHLRMTPIPVGERLPAAVATFTLRILHISDLHEGQPGPETLWRRRRVLGDAWLENLEVIADSGRGVDLVCFTGDVAFGGRREEYARAADFVRELLRRLGLGPERFFAVPGNHDADRDVQAEACVAICTWASRRSGRTRCARSANSPPAAYTSPTATRTCAR